MSKGSTIQLAFSSYKDEETGSEITRLTPLDVLCHRNYFYQKCFTNDGKKLMFAAEFDHGVRNYYLLDLVTQQARQLTEGKGDNTFGGFLSPNDDYLFYVKNDRELRKVNLDSLEETVIYTVPDDWVGYGTWVANSDCTSLVGIMISKEDWTPLTDWQKFLDFYHTNPHCKLIRVNLQTGEAATVLDQNVWLGHPIYRPYHDETIAFCHEGPHDLVDARMWLVDQDGKNERKVHTHREGESCTHEFWVPNGSALIYVSYLKQQQERCIRTFNPDTGEDAHLMKMPSCSHLMSNEDGSLLVGDGTGSPVDVNDANSYKITNDPWLYLFNAKTQQIGKLTKHNSTWRVLDGDRQVTHPHPSFTPDSKSVLYTTDSENGVPALYLATIPEDVFSNKNS